MKYKIKIELLSDLCSESGNSLSESVDTDVCTDLYGYPYIPAKRLKGVILEAFLDYLDITGNTSLSPETYFGEEDGDVSQMYLSDAVLPEHNFGESLENKEKVKEEFIYARAQTKVDNRTGICADGSLRTINVVTGGLSLFFELTTSLDMSVLKDTLALVRHIGGKRTRGLGQVKMTIEEEIKEEAKSSIAYQDEQIYEIPVLVQATNNLLIPAGNKNETLSYIPGTSIYGFFANRYIRDKRENNPEYNPMSDSDFLAMFIDKKVFFSNGYLSNSQGKEYLPIPAMIGKVKNTDNYVNRLWKSQAEPENGKVKIEDVGDCYGNFDGKDIEIMSPIYSFDYHHARDKANIGEGTISDEKFYQYYSLNAGQYFRFSLKSSGKYLTKLLSGLTEIRVGKSRTAQYGCLKIISDLKPSVDISVKERITAKEFFAFVESPLVILDEEGNYRIDSEAFKKELCLKIGKNPEELVLDDCKIKQRLISGFNILWKKPKIAFYGINSTSYFLFHFKNNVTDSIPSVLTIGQKQAEGFGKIILMSKEKVAPEKFSAHEYFANKVAADQNGTSKKIGKPGFKESQELALKVAEELKLNEMFNSSTLNRILLMLQESGDYDEFRTSVMSIKDNKKCSKFSKVIARFNNEKEVDDSLDYRAFFQTLISSAKYTKRGE
jgi:CRISPR-associated protein Csx10